MEARTSFRELAGNEDGMQSGMPLFRSSSSASFLSKFVVAIVFGSQNWNVMRVNKPLVTRTQTLMIATIFGRSEGFRSQKLLIAETKMKSAGGVRRPQHR